MGWLVLVFSIAAFIAAAMFMLVFLLSQMAATIMSLMIVVTLIGKLCLRRSRLGLSFTLVAYDHTGCRTYRRSHNSAIISAHFLSDQGARSSTHGSAHYRTGVCGKCRCAGEQQSCQ